MDTVQKKSKTCTAEYWWLFVGTVRFADAARRVAAEYPDSIRVEVKDRTSRDNTIATICYFINQAAPTFSSVSIGRMTLARVAAALKDEITGVDYRSAGTAWKRAQRQKSVAADLDELANDERLHLMWLASQLVNQNDEKMKQVMLAIVETRWNESDPARFML